MNPSAEFDLIVYGASGYTGRLVAEYLAKTYCADGNLRWAMAGRSAGKLAAVRDQIGAPAETPLVVAHVEDPESLAMLASRTKALITTVGPYAVYGAPVLAACVAAGTDYLDLCGEPIWMRQMIEAHDAEAKRSGSRVLFSCGFDSIPFELGVYVAQAAARTRFGRSAPRVNARVRALQGGISGGTAATGAATMAAVQRDPSLLNILMSPFGLTPGFEGAAQPEGQTPHEDPDVGPVEPFMMAVINTKNVHRSNLLMAHIYGQDFVYEEMAMAGVGFGDLPPPEARPRPGDGPTPEARESGFYDLVFIAIADDDRLRIAVKGDRDPGYGSTSKIIAETALTLIAATDVPGGIWTPGAALRDLLVERLQQRAGLSFTFES